MDDIIQLDKGVAALRYGSNGGQWDNRALIRVAAFITGVDLDSSSITEDQILDVVRPVEAFWDPERNVADIEVITGKRILGMTLGQWLVSYGNGFYRVLSNNDYLAQAGPTQPAPSFRQELQVLINKHGWDAKLHAPDFAVARHIHEVLNNLRGFGEETRRYQQGSHE